MLLTQRTAIVLLFSALTLVSGCTKETSVKSIAGHSVHAANVIVSAKVRILDNGSSPVAGALVSGTWSGAISGTGSAVTDSTGYATLVSPKSDRSGTYTLKVTGVSKAGMVYDSSKDRLSLASISR